MSEIELYAIEMTKGVKQENRDLCKIIYFLLIYIAVDAYILL